MTKLIAFILWLGLTVIVSGLTLLAAYWIVSEGDRNRVFKDKEKIAMYSIAWVATAMLSAVACTYILIN